MLVLKFEIFRNYWSFTHRLLKRNKRSGQKKSRLTLWRERSKLKLKKKKFPEKTRNWWLLCEDQLRQRATELKPLHREKG